MKKIKAYALVFIISIIIAGCTKKEASNSAQAELANNEQNTESANPDLAQKEVSMEGISYGDYNDLSANLAELVSKADLIVRIRVESVKPFITKEGWIQSEVIPNVLEVIKGNYSGQKLYIDGGEMLYEEFVGNEIIKETIKGHEPPEEEKEKNKGTLVRASSDGQYIFRQGEEYIYFAEQRKDTGLYYPQCAYQGVFKINGQTVENKALTEEPLKKDLIKIFEGKAIKKVGTNATKEGTSDTAINERAFIDEIKALVG